MSIVECKFENYTDYCCIISKQEINDEQIFFDGVHKEPKRNFDVDHLQFFNCVFRKMPKNFHENFPNLTKLSFWNSKMNFIEREHIGKLTELRSLMVINCGLQNLNGDLLCDLKKLQRISFANNKIENIDPEILDGLNYLKFKQKHWQV
ncbi:hypothetical protein PVAND_015538 [Polypedilum vanderplanki]|uniref:Uncharacterized protein n=1 Tax=Polypedilum vanderplanki TaxID=319348 RepID=A0A9J6BCG5_POLVA|nr:hypothetical protein PVAND_015538 [Polypedilum vanderplanki]